jgi:AraC-like DNA-binding protein
MKIDIITGSRRIEPVGVPEILFVLEGRINFGRQMFDAPLALPLVEPAELADARAVRFEGMIATPVVPDELSIQIVRETFFEFESVSSHCRAAIQYLLFRLEACEPRAAGLLTEHVLAFMRANPGENITLDFLCRQFGCSKSGLIAAFRRAGLRAPMKELANLRIEKACEMLRGNELNISQIARTVGYDDPAAFNHFFCRHIGRSPRDYRENCIWIV